MLAHLEASHKGEFLDQQLYAKLAEATRNRVIVFGPDLRVEYINTEAAAEFGESPANVNKPGWISALSPEQQRRDRSRIQRVFDTGAGERYEERREFTKGDRWVDTWLVPIKDEAGKVVKVLVSFQDISERKTAEEKMTRARDFYIYLFDNFPNPVWRVDASGRCNYVNKAARAFTGKEQAELMEDGWARSVHRDDAAGRLRMLEQAAKTKAHADIEYRMRGYDGTYRWVIDYVQPIYNLRNRFAGFYGAIVDVTERRLKADELAYMATHDVLTNTVNRRRFDEAIENAVAKAKRGGTSALLFIDLDDFKNVNDVFGHLEGDKALAAVAATARNILRKEDLLARLGGDEFAVILEGQSLADALIMAERLAEKVKKKVKVKETKALTISVGLTAIHEKTTAGKAMAEADAAMYEAKRRGGNRALLFEPGFIDYNY
jgi:diguanylate cyclase (GGDEF)-like protein/PAS domain S-box-containing protein